MPPLPGLFCLHSGAIALPDRLFLAHAHQDDNLSRALSTLPYVPDMSQSAVPSSPLSGDDTDRQLASGLRLIRLVSPLTLIPYLPPILTHMLALLAWPSQQRDAFNSLIDLLHSVYLDATGSALTLATSYAEYVATPAPQLCEDIVRLWSDAIRSLDPSSVRLLASRVSPSVNRGAAGERQVCRLLWLLAPPHTEEHGGYV